MLNRKHLLPLTVALMIQTLLSQAQTLAAPLSPRELTTDQVPAFVFENTWEGREYAMLNPTDGRPAYLTSPSFTFPQLREADRQFIDLKIPPEQVVNLNPWFAAMAPSFNLRLAVFEAMLSKNLLKDGTNNENSILKGAKLGGTETENPRDYFLKSNVTLDYQNVTPNATLEDAVDIKDVNSTVADSMKQGKAQLAVLCATRDFLHLKKCTEILSDILEFMEPKLRKSAINLLKKTYITAAPVFDRVMTNPNFYIEPLRKTAAKVIHQVDARKSTGNFYDDLLSSFKESGNSDEEALSRTWDILTIFASRGQNVVQEMREYTVHDNYPIFASLQVIASGAAVLDSLSLVEGHTYSLPPRVKTTGDFGKVYHFWMTAFLARTYTLKYGKEVPAIQAAQLAITGYEMRSNTKDRDPDHALTVSTYDPSNNKIRFDLALASAGALFGAQEAKGESGTIDINQGLIQLLRKAHDETPLPLTEEKALWAGSGVKGYIRWLKVFAPNAALKYYLKTAKKENQS